MNKKPFWQSRVIILNTLAGLIEVTQMVTGLNVIPAGTSLIIVNVLNIILRFVTKTKIGKDDDRNQV